MSKQQLSIAITGAGGAGARAFRAGVKYGNGLGGGFAIALD